jgi:signal transduction histidine kinase/FixJ family two-component response regulator
MAKLMHFLIAEDSADDAELLAMQLRRDGLAFTWQRVDNENDFLAALAKRPDLVLSDFEMPQFNGLRAAQLTREHGVNIPFILVSGTVGEDAAVEAMKHGAVDYLIKDRIGRLSKAVERALELKRLADVHQQAENELHWKTTLLEAQLESSLDGILIVDSQGKKILQNQRLAEMWKIPALAGKDSPDTVLTVFDAVREKNPAQFIEKVAHLNAHPEETSHDVIELLDGTVMDRYSAPVRDRSGKIHGRIWSFRDITERRKLEAQFRQAQKMESIGLLAGGIAHDFNNILAAITGNLFLAKQEAVGQAEILECLENISSAARRATALVNQILTFSRHNKQEREPLKLNSVVLEALKLLRATVPSTIRIQTELTITPTVLANATAIHQIVINLGTNAWHAMREQPGTLKVEMNVIAADDEFFKSHPGLRSGQYVRLSFSDTGHGMDAATVERIFDPFFSTKPVGEGTGLGLAVVLGIVQNHDGMITVQSEPGVGTTFHLYFPVLETAAAEASPAAPAIPQGQGQHILFVDDEIALANVGKKVLERLGFAVTTKTSALEALATVREAPQKFALVITDLTMPIMDGVKLGVEILKIEPRTPIILTTGYSLVYTEEKIRALGFRGLLVKPSSARDMGEAVQRALQPP